MIDTVIRGKRMAAELLRTEYASGLAGWDLYDYLLKRLESARQATERQLWWYNNPKPRKIIEAEHDRLVVAIGVVAEELEEFTAAQLEAFCPGWRRE